MNCFHFPDFASVHADNCGCAILSPGWTHPRRQLDSSVLIIGVRGRVPIMNGKDGHETEYVIESGTVVILPAGNIHYGSCAITEPAMYYWFHFTLAGAPNIVPQTDVDAMLDDDTRSRHEILQERPFYRLISDWETPRPFISISGNCCSSRKIPHTQSKSSRFYSRFSSSA